MSWTGLNGEKAQKLKDLNGKVVVLDFWAFSPFNPVQLISPSGFDGGNGKFVFGMLLTETGLFETDTGAAAGRHEAQRQKVKGKRIKARSFI